MFHAVDPDVGDVADALVGRAGFTVTTKVTAPMVLVLFVPPPPY